MLAQSSTPDRISILRPAVQARPDLQYVRASGLAQVRLQLAVLSGNRRRALEQIDRLVALDKELERIAEGSAAIAPPFERLADELADQRLAIASEKLALTSQISLPRLEPAFGAGMGAALAPDEEIEIVEDEALRSHFTRLLAWGAGFLVLCAGVATATITQF